MELKYHKSCHITEDKRSVDKSVLTREIETQFFFFFKLLVISRVTTKLEDDLWMILIRKCTTVCWLPQFPQYSLKKKKRKDIRKLVIWRWYSMQGQIWNNQSRDWKYSVHWRTKTLHMQEGSRKINELQKLLLVSKKNHHFKDWNWLWIPKMKGCRWIARYDWDASGFDDGVERWNARDVCADHACEC